MTQSMKGTARGDRIKVNIAHDIACSQHINKENANGSTNIFKQKEVQERNKMKYIGYLKEKCIMT